MADDQQPATQPVPDAQVSLKPSAVEVKQPQAEWTGSDLPYHTAETEKIAEKNAKKVKDQPYEYSANGYTVTKDDEDEDDFNEHGDPNPAATYTVTADGGFTRGGFNKRDAEIYVMSHDENHKTQPAEVSRA